MVTFPCKECMHNINNVVINHLIRSQFIVAREDFLIYRNTEGFLLLIHKLYMLQINMLLAGYYRSVTLTIVSHVATRYTCSGNVENPIGCNL